jgi:hypothetical protein
MNNVVNLHHFMKGTFSLCQCKLKECVYIDCNEEISFETSHKNIDTYLPHYSGTKGNKVLDLNLNIPPNSRPLPNFLRSKNCTAESFGFAHKLTKREPPF